MQSSRLDKNHDFFNSFRIRRINELAVTNKLTANFVGLITSGSSWIWPIGCQVDHALLDDALCPV
jgi:hypothetical protein